ncbi:MAG TPA: PP2C family protein-serine/threonine phosphatase [Acidisarcina sp.]
MPSLRRCTRLLLLLLAAFLASHAEAQGTPAGGFDGTDLHRVADISDAKWLVHAGDDPSWARPDYDDSHWQIFSTEDDIRTTVGPHKPDAIWYRLHLRVTPGEPNLALAEYNVASAFEIYSNGVLLLRAGSIVPYSGVTSIYKEALIPESQVANGAILVAIRVAFSNGEWGGAGPGLAPTNLLLGYERQLEDRRHYRVLVSSVTDWITGVLCIFVGLIALGLFVVDRQRREYLWAFLYGFTTALYLCIDLLRAYYPVPLFWFDVLTGVLGSLPAIAGLRFVWGTLGFKAGRWISLYQAIMLIIPPLLYISFDQGWIQYRGLVFATLPLSIPVNLILPIVTVREARRGNREAWMLLIPLLTGGLDTYLNYVHYIAAAFSMKFNRLDVLINTLNSMAVGSLRLSLGTATTAVSLCAIAFIIVLRTNRISRQLSRAAAELEAARSVQALLLSRESMATPGFEVESVYQPAQEVGGDFFLVSPWADGSLMVVIGDVSGKGLSAALRVSLILGALQREPSRRPGAVLTALNRVLCAQSDGGFTTCACAVLSPLGTLTLANAGHLSPYLDGEELAVEGGLPLGVVPDTQYADATYRLPSSYALVLMSDGVVEARNLKGELMGFAGASAISRQTAAQIAAAAQDFGQEDDITVLRITRGDLSYAAADRLASLSV